MKIVIFGYHQATYMAMNFLIEKGHDVLYVLPESKTGEVKYNNPGENFKKITYENINGKALQTEIENFQPDFLFTIIFGEKIPQHLIAVPKKYALNFHPSKLPDVRSGNAWYWPIRLGMTESGLSVHLLAEKWDSGDIVFERTFPIGRYDTQGMYHQKYTSNFPKWFEEFYPYMEKKKLKKKKQEPSPYYPKIKLKDLFIDWTSNAEDIYNHIRSCNPYHFAVSHYKSQHRIEFVEAEVSDIPAGIPGEILVKNNEMYVSCKDFYLRITVLFWGTEGIFSGKNFVNAFEVKTGEIFLNSGKLRAFKNIGEQIL